MTIGSLLVLFEVNAKLCQQKYHIRYETCTNGNLTVAILVERKEMIVK